MQLTKPLPDRDSRYTLDELVRVANELLPRLLPEERLGSKLKDDVNPRLVRNLSTLGLLDETLRDGREARYHQRHLLQLLVVRRLMGQGFTTGGIKNLISGASDKELEALLGDEVSIGAVLQAAGAGTPKEEPTESNSALRFLKGIRSKEADIGQSPSRRQKLPSIAASPASVPADAISRLQSTPSQSPLAGNDTTPSLKLPSVYVRIKVRPGLELQIGEEFKLPPSPLERETLAAEILSHLKALAQSGGARKRTR